MATSPLPTFGEDWMNSNSERYNLATIRNLIQSAFTPKELWRFCQDRPIFREAILEFGMNSSLAEMADVLLEYCQTRLLFDDLLTAIRKSEPRQFERYQAMLYSSEPLPPRQIPHNLPPRTEFVGREKEKTRIHEALHSRYFLISIEGIGGIGKTSLALEVAYECLHASQSGKPAEGIVTFDSFVWASAKDRDLTLNALLDAIAFTQDYPGIMQHMLEQKRLSVEELLRHRPCLLLVDNFDTVTDEGVWRFLRGLPEPSKALITTRKQKLSHVWVISLKGLEQPEALALMRSEGERLELASIKRADNRVLLYLHKATGGAPLALKWSIGLIKQRGQSLDVVLTVLREARGSIFEDIFVRSWDLLSADAQRALMVMPLFATSASKIAIEVASDVHNFALDGALGQLVEMSLLDATDELEVTRRRYSIHPLTRAFVGIKLERDPIFGLDARLRLAAYYVGRCNELGHWGELGGFPWFEIELPNIAAVIEWANLSEKWDVVVALFTRLSFFLGTCGYWQERIKYGEMALKSAQRSSNSLAAARCQHSLGWILARQGRHADAEKLIHDSIRSYLDIGHNKTAVLAMITLAKTEIAQGNLGYAQEIADKATEYMDCEKQDEEYKSIAKGLLTARGRIAFQSGNLALARSFFVRALQVTKESAAWISASGRCIDLANVALAQHRLDEADSYFIEGLNIGQDYHRQDNIARAHFGLARVQALRGEKAEAMRHGRIAQGLFTKMDMQDELGHVCEFLQDLNDERQYE